MPDSMGSMGLCRSFVRKLICTWEIHSYLVVSVTGCPTSTSFHPLIGVVEITEKYVFHDKSRA